MRSTSNASWGSVTATVWRAAPAGMRSPAISPTDRSDRPAGEQHALRLDDTAGRLDARHPAAVVGRAQAGERGSFAQLDAGRLHRQRVRPHVARRVDVAVTLPEAPAAMALRRERADRRRRLGRVQPAHIGQAGAVLHRDPLPAQPLVRFCDRQDQIALLAKAGIGAIFRCLPAIEVDRPASERDRRRRAALRPYDAGGPRRGTHPGQPALDHYHPPHAGLGREHRRPAADGSCADDDQIRSIRHATLPCAATGREVDRIGR